MHSRKNLLRSMGATVFAGLVLFLLWDVVVPEDSPVQASVPCDPEVARQPTHTPFSIPPVIEDPTAARKAIDKARRAIPPGDVRRTRLWVLIDTAGNVSSVRIAESSGSAEADSASLGVARSFRYVPAQLDDRAVCVWVNMPLNLS